MKHLGTSRILLLLFLILPLTGQAQRNPFFPGSTEEYSQPLYFDVIGNGVEAEPLLLSYQLSDDALTMGTLKMQTDDFFVNLVTLKKPNTSTEDVFIVQWPEFFMRTGILEFISRSGKVLWSLSIEEKMLEQWKSTLGGWKTQAQYGVRNASSQNSPLWNIKEPFRACLTKSSLDGQTRLCSAQFRVEMTEKKPRVFKVPFSKQPPRVIVDNEQAPLQQTAIVKPGVPVQFYAELNDGSSFEFYAVPPKVNFVDMTGNKEKTVAMVITEGDPPLQKTEIINKEKNSRLVEFIGWQQTIGDFRQYWKTKIPFGETQIMLAGKGGGAFLQKLKIENLPHESTRVFLSPDAIEGTYVDGTSLYIRKASATQVNSKQNSVQSDSESPDEFIWKFGAKKRGQINRSYLLVNDGKDTFKAYHELYKGFPREISLRSSAIGSKESQVIFGELAFVYWFEDILGWNSPRLSKQRWGLNARTFRSVTDLKLGSVSAPFQTSTIELKYRLTPGMWARKETWGLIGGYQQVGYRGNRTVAVTASTTTQISTDFGSQLFGLGFFWARSMPKIFDDILNHFPLMDYPKWVDAEFIYYPMTTTDAVEMNKLGFNSGTYSLNFHGQVMWSERFFGEAGFGIKQYDYIKAVPGASGTTAKIGFTFAGLYGTVGLGYRF